MTMNCEEFEKLLPDYFEGDLSDEARAAVESHAKSCDACRMLVADIERITRDAAMLPSLTPSRDLWSGIEQRISAPVIPLSPPARHSGRRLAAGWMAAAAAALIVTTAGVTYLATRPQSPSPATLRVVTKAPSTSVPAVGTTDTAAIPATSAGGRTESSERAPEVKRSGSTLALSGSAGQGRPAAVNASAAMGSLQADEAYAHEIRILQRMVDKNTSGLDPKTIDIIKTNLQVIDDAIAQSRVALLRDPASKLLHNQLTHAQDKKIELLRTVAALSSST